MNDMQLTKDADALLCVLYKEYLHRRDAGLPKVKSRYFGDSKFIQAALMQKWSLEDVDETCRELSRRKLLECYFFDNLAAEVILTDDALACMERRFSNGLSSVLTYLERIRALLPW